MLGGSNKYQYLCSAKKGREGLCHQRTKTQAGHRALSEFAKKETLRIVPQQFLTIKRDTVQLTYPLFNETDFVCIGNLSDYTTRISGCDNAW